MPSMSFIHLPVVHLCAMHLAEEWDPAVNKNSAKGTYYHRATVQVGDKRNQTVKRKM